MPQIKSSDLAIGQVFASTSPADKTFIITDDPTNHLRVGLHVFTLVVTDDSGNPSQAAQALVTVLDDQAPTAIVAQPQQRIPFGTDFTIDGSPSTDVGGGTVVKWEWTLVQRP
jgi:hypothetical protein